MSKPAQAQETLLLATARTLRALLTLHIDIGIEGGISPREARGLLAGLDDALKPFNPTVRATDADAGHGA